MKKNYLPLFILFSIFCIPVSFIAQSNYQHLIKEKLPDYLVHVQQEKVYVQTDREQYLQNDTIWFKASLVNAMSHRPVGDEKYLYVDFIDGNNKIVFHQIYELFNGFTGGYLPIYSNAKPGKYQLVAYTNHMKNFSEDFFFRKNIDITGSEFKPLNWEIKERYIPGDIRKDTLRLNLKAHLNNFDTYNNTYEVNLFYNDSVSLIKTVDIGESGFQIDFIVPAYLANESPIISIQSFGNDYFPPYKKQLLASKAKIDLQFLPEGGVMVNGTSNKVAFKALNSYGNPADVVGNIIDNEGNMVANFQAVYEGCGFFDFVPQSGKHYSAIISDNGKFTPIELPKAQEFGVTMSLTQEKDNKIRFLLNPKLEKETPFLLVGHTRGIPYFAKKGTLYNNSGQIEIDKSSFPSGIGTFTLFIDEKPYAERLVYIDNNDQIDINVNLSKDQFKSGEKVDLKVKATHPDGTPAIGSFAISASEVLPNFQSNHLNNIQNYLLLSSDIHGQLPKNTDYIDPKNPNKQLFTDLLLMTNGWRRFSWDDITGDTLPQLEYKKETNMYLKGMVTKRSDTKPAGANQKVIAQLKGSNGIFIEQGITNKKGQYYIEIPDFTGELDLNLLTRRKNGTAKDYNFSLESNVDGFKYNRFAFNKITALDNSSFGFIDYSYSYNLNNNEIIHSIPTVREDKYYFPGRDVIEIKQVDVRSKYINQRDSLFKQTGTPDVVIESTQLEAFVESTPWYSTIWDLLNENIPGLTVDYGINKFANLIVPLDSDTIGAVSLTVHDNPRGGLMIIVDGIFLNSMYSENYFEFFNLMEPSEIKSINFIAKPKNVDPMYKNMNLLGVRKLIASGEFGEGEIPPDPSYLYITTKSGKGPFFSRPKGAISTKLKGLSVYRKFYSPKYNPKEPLSPENLKKTVHWDANVITDSLGEATVSFNSNGIKDHVFINLQGLSIKGKTGVYLSQLPLNNNYDNKTKQVHNENQKIHQTFPEYILKGRIIDAESKQPIEFANISQNSKHKSTITNMDGIFIIDQDEFSSDSYYITSKSHLPKKIKRSDLIGMNNEIELTPCTLSATAINESVQGILKKMHKYRLRMYSNEKSYKGFTREAILFDNNVYAIEEMEFHYGIGKNVDFASNKRLEVNSFRIYQDFDGNPMPTVNPNHREPFYAVDMDIMAFAPDFLNRELFKEFEWKLLGSEMYDNRDCYVIAFDQKPELYHSREKGKIYIAKTSYAILNATWEKSPRGLKYLSNTYVLNNTPKNHLKPVKIKYEVNYGFVDGQLMMKSGKKTIRLVADNKHLVDFETETVINQIAEKSYRDLKTNTVESIILNDKARSFLTKKPNYGYEEWRYRGITPLPEKYLKDLKFLHEIVMYY